MPAEPMELPTVGQRLMLRRMVDPVTRRPVPVRVAQLVDWTDRDPPVWVVVLTREQ